MHLILVKYCSYIPSSCEVVGEFLLEFDDEDAGGYRKTSLGPLCSSLTTNETPNIIMSSFWYSTLYTFNSYTVYIWKSLLLLYCNEFAENYKQHNWCTAYTNYYIQYQYRKLCSYVVTYILYFYIISFKSSKSTNCFSLRTGILG